MSDLTQHLRQYQHNDCSGFVFGYDKTGIDRLVALLEAQNADLRQQLADKTAATVQPVAWLIHSGDVRKPVLTVYTASDAANYHPQWVVPMIAAPQPQAAQSEDSRDAARYRFAFIESPKWTFAVCKWDGSDWLPIQNNDEIDAALAQAGKEQSK
jgi:hypothetical protein